jgi:hypothetical protein
MYSHSPRKGLGHGGEEGGEDARCQRRGGMGAEPPSWSTEQARTGGRLFVLCSLWFGERMIECDEAG